MVLSFVDEELWLSGLIRISGNQTPPETSLSGEEERQEGDREEEESQRQEKSQ